MSKIKRRPVDHGKQGEPADLRRRNDPAGVRRNDPADLRRRNDPAGVRRNDPADVRRRNEPGADAVRRENTLGREPASSPARRRRNLSAASQETVRLGGPPAHVQNRPARNPPAQQHSAQQHSAQQHSAEQHSAEQHSAEQHSAQQASAQRPPVSRSRWTTAGDYLRAAAVDDAPARFGTPPGTVDDHARRVWRTAFGLAVRRRFEPDSPLAEISRTVAAAVHAHESAGLPAIDVEMLVRAELGETVPVDELDPAVLIGVHLLVFASLADELALGDGELDDLVTRAEQLAATPID